MNRDAWASYVNAFHHRYPGITQDVLRLARNHAGLTPYEWIAAELPPVGLVVDLACGAGPLAELVGSSRWLGLDISAAEVGRARDEGVRGVVRADVRAVPLASASVDTLVCSMALMVAPVADVFRESARLLRPGGCLIATTPTWRGQGWADLRRTWTLWRAWGDRPQFASRSRESARWATYYGMEIASDLVDRFDLPLDRDSAQLLADSLYAPRSTDESRRRLVDGLLTLPDGTFSLVLRRQRWVVAPVRTSRGPTP